MFAYMNGWLIFVVDVGKYTMTMDPMGKKDGEYIGATEGSGIFLLLGSTGPQDAIGANKDYSERESPVTQPSSWWWRIQHPGRLVDLTIPDLYSKRRRNNTHEPGKKILLCIVLVV